MTAHEVMKHFCFTEVTDIGLGQNQQPRLNCTIGEHLHTLLTANTKIPSPVYLLATTLSGGKSNHIIHLSRSIVTPKKIYFTTSRRIAVQV